MKFLLPAFLLLFGSFAYADTPPITIPENEIALIKTADFVEVTGTNDAGGAEDFSIHNSKAISQFVQFLTSERYIAVPKNLKPDFKAKSVYKVRLSSKGTPLLEFLVIGDSILDLPNEAAYYTPAERYADDNIMAPLLRLR